MPRRSDSFKNPLYSPVLACADPPPPPPAMAIPREISASSKFEALAVRGGRTFSLKTTFLNGFWRPEAPGGSWRPPRRPGSVWKTPTCMEQHLQTLMYTMAYNIYNDGFRVLGTRNWDLRWIVTRALLRDTRSFSYRSVARPQYAFRLLVKCLWTPEGFQAPSAIH